MHNSNRDINPECVATNPWRSGEPKLPCFLLSWAGQRAPSCPSYKTSHSRNYHVVYALAASFLAGFEALGERKGASNAWWGSTKDKTASEGARLMCRALRPTTDISHILAIGFRRCAGAARKYFSLIISCGGFLVPGCVARRSAARGSAMQDLGRRGALPLSSDRSHGA